MTMPILAASEKNKQINSAKYKSQNRWISALLVSALGGFSLGLTGLIMSGIAYFEMTGNSKQVNQIGTWLIVIAFPVIIFGAHALDKIKENETNKN